MASSAGKRKRRTPTAKGAAVDETLAMGGSVDDAIANLPSKALKQSTEMLQPSAVLEAHQLAGSPYRTSPDFIVSLVHTKCEALRVEDNKVFVAERTDKVVDVFKGLMRHNFLSVPVLQKTKHRWYGFLDMADIVKYITDTFGEGKLASAEDFWALVEKEEEFQKKTVNDIMKYPLNRRNPFHPVKKGYSLLYAMEALAKEPMLHRVPVVDDDRNLVNLITQSHMVRFLQMNMAQMGPKKNKPVAEVAGVFHQVIGANLNQRAIDAFEMLVKENVSGIAILDDEGKIHGNLSLRDLKVMSTDDRLFWRLYQPLHTFIDKVRQEDAQRPRRLKTVTVNATLEEVIDTLAEHQIHRVFIIDDNKKPIGVISLKDVLLEILN